MLRRAAARDKADGRSLKEAPAEGAASLENALRSDRPKTVDDAAMSSCGRVRR